MRAAEAQGVDIFLIFDKLFQAQGLVKRKKYVKLVDDVCECEGNMKIFCSMHVSREQLEQLNSLCASLRFLMQIRIRQF